MVSWYLMITVLMTAFVSFGKPYFQNLVLAHIRVPFTSSLSEALVGLAG